MYIFLMHKIINVCIYELLWFIGEEMCIRSRDARIQEVTLFTFVRYIFNILWEAIETLVHVDL